MNSVNSLNGSPKVASFVLGSIRLVAFLLALYSTTVSAMSLIDAANFAVRQSPASTRFITNKMCPFAQKAYIALEVSNAPYEMEEISLYGAGGK